MNEPLILTLSCTDRPGIVARVTSLLAESGGNILEAQQFDDVDNVRFFMRVVFALAAPTPALTSRLEALAGQLGLTWQLRPAHQRRKVLLLVSRFDHCLADLLYRTAIGELEMDIVAIASNHPASVLRHHVPGEVPFHHFPIDPATRPRQEALLRALIEATGAELVVLARYMQVLSPELSGWLEGRCINIHHSFLPGFKGARPYHQAHARGVKMIGATAHYVTAELDDGPIIHQDVEPISHADRPEDLIRKGRDIERRVLAEAVRLHLEDRVLINGPRTVVFKD